MTSEEQAANLRHVQEMHRALLRAKQERKVERWAERAGAQIPGLLLFLVVAAVTAFVLFTRHHG